MLERTFVLHVSQNKHMTQHYSSEAKNQMHDESFVAHDQMYRPKCCPIVAKSADWRQAVTQNHTGMSCHFTLINLRSDQESGSPPPSLPVSIAVSP